LREMREAPIIPSPTLFSVRSKDDYLEGLKIEA